MFRESKIAHRALRPAAFFATLSRFSVLFFIFLCGAVTIYADISCETTSFQPTPNFPTGITPTDIVVVDFNGDSNPDLATANLGSNSVTVLMGRGAEGFAPPVNYAVGGAPRAVEAGDFNGDGKTDLATVNSETNNISLLFGDGTGQFTAATNVSAPTQPFTLAVDDFNADGKADLAVGNSIDGSRLHILLGNGQGGFSAASGSPITLPTGPREQVTGDFNEDGKRDLAVATGTDGFSLLLGNGAGGFAEPVNIQTPGISPFNIAVADFNADGHLDVVTSNPSSNNISVLLGNGSGGFGPANNFSGVRNPSVITTGDFNGDGKPDVAVTSSFMASVTVFLGNGQGGFGTARNFASRFFPASVATADFNRDGKLDIAVANGSGTLEYNGVSLLLGDGAGEFDAAKTAATGNSPGPMTSADFNNDGKLDLAVLNVRNFGAFNYSVSVLLNDGQGNLTESQKINFNNNQSINAVAAGDFNQDGKVDLAVTVLSQSGIAILLGDGTGRFGVSGPGGNAVVTSISSYVSGANDVKVADFNNDGKPDLVVTSSLNRGFAILLGDGAGNFNPIAGLPFSKAGEVVVADFNTDGKADLALLSDKVYILLGDGTGHFTNSLGLDAKFVATALATGDFDGDGKVDLAVASDNRDFLGLVKGKGSVSIFPGNGAGGFAARRDFETGWSPLSLTVGEFNGDGKLDVATADSYNDNISVLAGDGSGNLLSPMSYDLGTDPTRILSGNFTVTAKLISSSPDRSPTLCSSFLITTRGRSHASQLIAICL